MNKISLTAETREISGRKVKKLRKDGKIPANISGRNFKSHSITVNKKDFETVFSKAGETGLIEISTGNEKKPVLIHNIQKDPITDSVLHVDFLQVDLKQKVSAMVPIELTGQSPAEKQSLGTVVQYVNELEVEALPENLPDKFEVDLSVLEDVDQAIYVKDVKIDKEKVEISKDAEEVVVKVEPLREEKEELPAPTEDVEAAKEGEEVKETDEANKDTSSGNQE